MCWAGNACPSTYRRESMIVISVSTVALENVKIDTSCGLVGPWGLFAGSGNLPLVI